MCLDAIRGAARKVGDFFTGTDSKTDSKKDEALAAQSRAEAEALLAQQRSSLSSAQTELDALRQSQRIEAPPATAPTADATGLTDLLAEAKAQTASAQSIAKQTVASLQASTESAAAASATPAMSESARRAAEKRMRRLLASSGFFTAPAPGTAPAPVGYRTLLGQ